MSATLQHAKSPAQTPPSRAAPPQQAPIEIGRTDDPAEHEANRVASQLLRTPDSAELHRSPTAASGSAPPIVHEVLSTAGRPLDVVSRAYFEPRLGTDLSDVRIHDESDAARAADAVGARAFTVGNHIAFAQSRQNPGAPSGDRLLAHELVHVAQQRAPSPTLGQSHETAKVPPRETRPSVRAPRSASDDVRGGTPRDRGDSGTMMLAADPARVTLDPRVAARPGIEVAVLGFQRLAGNRAVRQLLRQPAPLLGGLDAATKHELQIATVNVPADFADDETFARKAPAEFKDVDVQYGAKVPKDKAFRTGLQVIAWDLLDLKGRSADIESPFRDNSTVMLDLALKQFKGEDGLWQFTYTTTGTPVKKRLLIDYVGAAPKYDTPDTAAKDFGQLGLKQKAGTASFSPDEKDAIYSAVSLLPAAAVAKLPNGLTFVRDQTPHAGKCTPPPANSSGFYCSADNTITLFDRWHGSQVRYARATSKVATVLHEIGHAIDHANHDAHDAFAQSLKDDGATPVSGYGAKDTPESYAESFFLYVVDPQLLEALRPHVYAYFDGQFGAATSGAASSGTGAGVGSGATLSKPGATGDKGNATSTKADAQSGAAPKH